MSMSVTLGGMDLAPLTPVVFAYEREGWEKMWLNSRISRVNESMGETRAAALSLVLAGHGDEAAALWGHQVDAWVLMLASPAEQAAAIRASA